MYVPNGCRLNRHFNLKNTCSWTFCRQQNSVTFCHPKTIKVSKIFYFFRKSRKFSKKGLKVSIRTHMAHLNMLVVGYMVGWLVKNSEISDLRPTLKTVSGGCKYSSQALSGPFRWFSMHKRSFPDHLSSLQKIQNLVISGPNLPQIGYLQKFLPSFWGRRSCACCPHILDTARGHLLGTFKRFWPTHTPILAPSEPSGVCS